MVKVVVAFCLIVLLVCPACTMTPDEIADDIIRRFIPSCAMGEKKEKEEIVEIRCSAYAYVTLTEYDINLRSRQIFDRNEPIIVTYEFLKGPSAISSKDVRQSTFKQIGLLYADRWGNPRRNNSEYLIARVEEKNDEKTQDIYISIRKGEVIIVEAFAQRDVLGGTSETYEKRLTWDEAKSSAFRDERNKLRSSHRFVFYFRIDRWQSILR